MMDDGHFNLGERAKAGHLMPVLLQRVEHGYQSSFFGDPFYFQLRNRAIPKLEL